MVKHNFKIGDKVKSNIEKVKGLIGRVSKITPSYVLVSWNTNKCIICKRNTSPPCRIPITSWYYKHKDIEHLRQKGEQLMLFE